MKKLIEYACSFDPEFQTRIAGAPPEQIAELEVVVGRPLPRFYREFLERMGKNDARLLSREDIWIDPPSVIEFYREEIATGEDSVPADCILIAHSGMSIENLYLEVDEPGALFDGALSQKHTMWATSLEKYLYHVVYMIYPHRAFEHVGYFTCDRDTVVTDPGRAEGARMGFVEQWFSDRITYCAARSDAVLIINQLERGGPYIQIAAARPETVAEIRQRIAEASGAMLEPMRSLADVQPSKTN